MEGGDLKTLPRQHGGIFGLLGKLFGLGPGELQKQMSDPIKQQMLMQRGGFPWALAGLSLLPTLLGKGEQDRIRNQMKTARDPIMQRGGLTVPPALITKGLPLLKQIGIPAAMGALASLGDNLVDKVFGEGKKRVHRKMMKRSRKATHRKVRHFDGRKQKSGLKRTMKRTLIPIDHVQGAVKKKARRVARYALKDVGRRLFEKSKTVRPNLRLESSPRETPFAQKLRQSIQTTMSKESTPTDSSHIGQTFNI